jgi:hypothetical protein
MLRVRLALVALVVSFGTVVADTPKKATPTPTKDKAGEISAADADKYLAFFNKLMDAIVQNKNDCKRMGVAMNQTIDANQEIIKKIASERAAGKKYPKGMQEKMEARVGDMVAPMSKCGEDKDVKAAIGRINTDAPADKTPPKK